MCVVKKFVTMTTGRSHRNSTKDLGEGKKRGEILDGPGLGSRAGGAFGGRCRDGGFRSRNLQKKSKNFPRLKRLGTKQSKAQSESTAESKNAKAKHKSTAQSKAQSNVAESKSAKAKDRAKHKSKASVELEVPKGQRVRVQEFKSQE